MTDVKPGGGWCSKENKHPFGVCCMAEHCPSTVGLWWRDLGRQKCQNHHVFSIQRLLDFSVFKLFKQIFLTGFVTREGEKNNRVWISFIVICAIQEACNAINTVTLLSVIQTQTRRKQSVSSICLWQCTAGLRPETMSYSISTWKSLAGIHHVMSVSARMDIIHTPRRKLTPAWGN